MAPPQRRYWDDPDYCETANGVERRSALYGYICTEVQQPPKKVDDYKPFPDPVDLDRRVSQICGSYSRDTRQCFFENKQKIILAANPDIRDACADQLNAGQGNSLRDQLRNRLRERSNDDYPGDPNDNAYNRCVDDAYLHGLPKKSDVSLREALKQRLAERGETRENPNKAAADRNHNEPRRPPPERLPNDGCGPGHGLKPDPTAFGAWTCQPLGSGLPGQDNRVAGVPDSPLKSAPQGQSQAQVDAPDPTLQELEDYLNMLNPNSGGNLRGDLGKREFSWGSDDYLAIEKLQRQ
jgi:hypothetical protein